MKNKKTLLFLCMTALCGGAAAVLRIQMLATGLDEKGLLVAGNPYCIALWVVTIGYMAALALGLRKLPNHKEYGKLFPACKLRGILSIAGGALLLLESVRIIPTQQLAGILGVLAGVGMLLAGLCRFIGKHPSPLFHILVCLFYIVRLVLSFQRWSSDPQLQDYVMQILAGVSLMMFAFYRASCDADMAKRRITSFYGLAAVYFCLASVSDEAMPLLYIASGLWAVGAGGTLDELPEENTQSL